MRDLPCAVIALAIVSGAGGCLDVPRTDTPRPTVDELIQRAERGDEQALFELGNRHVDGDGVARDNVLAYMWFSLAAERLTTEEATKPGACSSASTPTCSATRSRRRSGSRGSGRPAAASRNGTTPAPDRGGRRHLVTAAGRRRRPTRQPKRAEARRS